MHCPFNNALRDRMMLDLEELCIRHDAKMLESGELFLNLIGKHIPGVEIDMMKDFWAVSGRATSNMYVRVERARPKTGVG